MAPLTRLLLVLAVCASRQQCDRVSRKKFLFAPTHSGMGNQLLGLEKAAWLAFATNRTLIVPPMLTHAFGTAAAGGIEIWPKCEDVKWISRFSTKATQRYNAIISASPKSTRFSSGLDFDYLKPTGLRLINYVTLHAHDGGINSFQSGSDAGFKVNCKRTKGLNAAQLRKMVPEEPRIVRVGSALRMDLDTLRKDMISRGGCARDLVQRLAVPHFNRQIADFAKEYAASLGPFVTVHLRSGDTNGHGNLAVARSVLTMLVRLIKIGKMPSMTLYIMYDLEESRDLLTTSELCQLPRRCVTRIDALRSNASFTRRLVRTMRPEFLGIIMDFEVGRYGLDFARTEQGAVKFLKTSAFAVIGRRLWVETSDPHAARLPEAEVDPADDDFFDIPDQKVPKRRAKS
ncbi:hypothetical protein M885DRAFT_542286 [Pelagophyceae sp. CCMP2097]|nr:hypothetical protein M885DRAFT_544125 [Pelagophyceae sp. CCMP2097]KAJ1447594.1 hypothetical protein M885DRAFT_542286 [Pelagophyceae sp. CCMP2097]